MANNKSVSLPALTPEITEAFAPQVLEVIRNSIAPTANDQEFLLFAHKAASYGLDPFKNEIFFIKYGNTARIQFAAEAYLSKAREKEGFLPPDTQMVHENDEFKVVKNPETKELEVKQHDIGFPRGKIIGAYSIAYREGSRPVTVIVDIDQVAHMFTGQNKDNWNKWTSDMLGKFVEQRALKKQYGLDFEDMTIGEGGDDSGIPAYKPSERKDITPEPEIIDAPKPDKDEKAVKQVRASMTNVLNQLGVSGKKATADYLKEKNIHIPENPSLDQLNGALKTLEAILEVKQMENNDDDLLDDDLEKGFED